MPFEIVRNDIAQMAVDAIVNTANPQPVIGAGVDARIHQQAGPKLLKARQRIGSIAVGSAAVTPAYDLQARYVIHTVGPIWQDGTKGEERLLRNCYDNTLKLACRRGCKSIAFPLIASGNYGFPKELALEIALSAFRDFLEKHEMQLYLVVFDRDAFRLSEKLVQQVASYIDQHYVDRFADFTYSAVEDCRCRSFDCIEEEPDICEAASAPMPQFHAPKAARKAVSLEELLKQEDAGFSETLLRLIDKTGKKDSEIYKKANISKQHFSKIRNNPDYRPTKATALALAIALELDLDATKDLIGRAGYALTNSSKFDLIIRFFIENRNYNVMEINMTLYEFDQSLLGA